jgi:uncharacterized damage-inducible protein DinB
MQRKDVLIQGWDFAYDLEGWYPPLKQALKDVDAAHAIWSAPGEASNTIGQLVHHLLYYKERFLYRLEQKTWPYKVITNEQTFLPLQHTLDLPWEKLVSKLSLIHSEIRKKIFELTDHELDSNLPDNPIDWQILTLVMHDAYHTGQIVFIRKLYGSWPGIREV